MFAQVISVDIVILEFSQKEEVTFGLFFNIEHRMIDAVLDLNLILCILL